MLIDRVYYNVAHLFVKGENYATKVAIKKARHQGVKVGKNCRFYSTNFSTEPYLIEIGDHVTITSGVQFITHDGGVWVIRGLDEKYKDIDLFGRIKIGNNVFIGLNTIILPGTEIGDNTIIAAGSIVKGKFDGNSVIGGVPAKRIKSIDEYLTKNDNMFLYTKHMKAEDKKKTIFKYFNML